MSSTQSSLFPWYTATPTWANILLLRPLSRVVELSFLLWCEAAICDHCVYILLWGQRASTHLVNIRIFTTWQCSPESFIVRIKGRINYKLPYIYPLMKENYFLQESGEIAPTYPSPDKKGLGWRPSDIRVGEQRSFSSVLDRCR